MPVIPLVTDVVAKATPPEFGLRPIEGLVKKVIPPKPPKISVKRISKQLSRWKEFGDPPEELLGLYGELDSLLHLPGVPEPWWKFVPSRLQKDWPVERANIRDEFARTVSALPAYQAQLVNVLHRKFGDTVPVYRVSEAGFGLTKHPSEFVSVSLDRDIARNLSRPEGRLETAVVPVSKFVAGGDPNLVEYLLPTKIFRGLVWTPVAASTLAALQEPTKEPGQAPPQFPGGRQTWGITVARARGLAEFLERTPGTRFNLKDRGYQITRIPVPGTNELYGPDVPVEAISTELYLFRLTYPDKSFSMLGMRRVQNTDNVEAFLIDAEGGRRLAFETITSLPRGTKSDISGIAANLYPGASRLLIDGSRGRLNINLESLKKLNAPRGLNSIIPIAVTLGGGAAGAASLGPDEIPGQAPTEAPGQAPSQGLLATSPQRQAVRQSLENFLAEPTARGRPAPAKDVLGAFLGGSLETARQALQAAPPKDILGELAQLGERGLAQAIPSLERQGFIQRPQGQFAGQFEPAPATRERIAGQIGAFLTPRDREDLLTTLLPIKMLGRGVGEPVARAAYGTAKDVAAVSSEPFQGIIRRMQDALLNRRVARARARVPGLDPGTIPEEATQAVSSMQVPSGAIEPRIVSPALSKLLEVLRGATRTRVDIEAAQAAERSKRAGPVFGIAKRIRGGQVTPDVGSGQILGALKGPLPTRQIALEQGAFTVDDINELGIRVFDSFPAKPMTANDTWLAFKNLVEEGKAPTRSEIAQLAKAFGPEVGERLMALRSRAEKGEELAGELINISRSLVSTADFSAYLRQGFLLGPGHPIAFARSMGRATQSFFSEKAATRALKAIEENPLAPLLERFRVSQTQYDRFAPLVEREELFMSNILERLPVSKQTIGQLTRASTRNYVVFLNKLRADVFYGTARRWIKQGYGPDVDPERYELLARWVNVATGRGSLGKPGSRTEKIATRYMPILTGTFFAPRLTLSRIQAPTSLLTKNRAVLGLVAKDMAAAFTTALTMGSLAYMAGKWAGENVAIERDPRSSDFGKVQVGNTRYDLFAGYLPLARYASQLIMNERKTLEGGQIVPADTMMNRFGTAQRFVRSKLAPVPSFIVDWSSGKDFLGRDFNLPRAVLERIMSLFWADFADALMNEWEDSGPEGLAEGAAKGAPGFLGVGVQTFEPGVPGQGFPESLPGVGEFFGGLGPDAEPASPYPPGYGQPVQGEYGLSPLTK